mgnify:FL=1
MSNKLKNEISPYLLQHADNPVDWFPWDEAAFEHAAVTKKPILLSVGYAACHWCHVMAHESFENKDIAEYMNEHFVCIKVDREERPDIDSIYMNVVQALTGHGGWPLTVFLTPEKLPFYGGTYFPPEDLRGIPSFRRVLHSIKDAYDNRHEDVERNAEYLSNAVSQIVNIDQSSLEEDQAILLRAFQVIKKSFDSNYGGFGSAPKFPQPLALRFLLAYYSRTKDPESLSMVNRSLEALANGGIYDHLGGGFHRYATDEKWKIPHFEKMLYDNSLLALIFAEAFQVTGESNYQAISEQTLDYLIREMRHPDGGFFSSQDADTEGIEGKFYTWDSNEITESLGYDFKSFSDYYGILENGNWEGTNILHVDNFSHSSTKHLGPAREKLFKKRLARVSPEIDDKVITAWNGLAIQAFAKASQVFGRNDYEKIAVETGLFLLKQGNTEAGLKRIWRNQATKQSAYLEDYANLALAFIKLHETTLNHEWLKQAYRFTIEMIDLFYDENSGRFFDTSVNQESLFVRPSQSFDGPTPSGASTATMCLLWLAQITGESKFSSFANKLLGSVGKALENYPLGHGNWLTVLETSVTEIKVIAIAGDKNDKAVNLLKKAVHSVSSPNILIVGWDPSDGSNFNSPLFENRSLVNGQPTAYLCIEFECSLPTSDPLVLLEQMESL